MSVFTKLLNTLSGILEEVGFKTVQNRSYTSRCNSTMNVCTAAQDTHLHVGLLGSRG